MPLANVALTDLITFTRGSGATDFDAAGALVEFAAAQPRRGFDPVTRQPAGFLLEGQVTNQVANARFEFSDGTIFPTASAPINMSLSGPAFSQLDFVRTTEAGHDCLDVYLTATGPTSVLLYVMPGNLVAAAQGQTWTAAITSRLISGDPAVLLPGCNVRCAYRESNNTGLPGFVDTQLSLTDKLTRVSSTATAPAGAAFVQQAIRFGCSGPGSWVIRLAAPQLEQNHFASSIILPAPGARAASTRAVDGMYLDGPRFNATWPLLDPRQNTLPYSAQLDQAAWAKVGVSVVQNVATAPDGSGLADRLVEDTANADHRLNMGSMAVVAGANTISAYVKAETRSRAKLQWDGTIGGTTAGVSCTADLAAGTVGWASTSGNMTPLAAGILPVGNGWYRIWVQFIPGAPTSGTVRLFMLDGVSAAAYQGDGTSSLLAWGFQMEASPVAFSPNGVAHTESLDQPWWGKSGSTITANAIASPDGTLSADKINEDTTSAPHGVNSSSFSITATEPQTASVYFKAAERSWARLCLMDASGTDAVNAYFNLAAGTVGQIAPQGTISGARSSIQDAGNGWYRCTVTAAINNNRTQAVILLRTASGDGTSGFAGTSGSGVYAWGAAVNPGSAAHPYNPISSLLSPYIATVAAPAIAHFGTAKEGVVIVEGMLTHLRPSGSGIVQVDDNSDRNRFLIRVASNGAVQGFRVKDNSGTGGAAVGTVTPGVPFRVGMRWANGVASFCCNGGALGQHSAGPLGGFSRLSLGRENFGYFMDGRIRGVWASHRVPTDAQLQAMTVPGADIAAALAA